MINKTIRFLIIVGIIVFIDNELSISKRSIEMMISNILNLENVHSGIGLYYTSIHASIAVILSSNLNVIRKIIYSTGLFFLYIMIFTFIVIYIFRYGEYLLYLWFITMSIPILLWKFLEK